MEQIKILHEGKEKKYPLESSHYVIGRSSTCEIQIQDPSISRKHCEIKKQGRDWLVYDLGSHNGTFINGTRIDTPRILSFGDTIKLGSAATQITIVKGEGNSVETGEFAGRGDKLVALQTGAFIISRKSFYWNTAIIAAVICVITGVVVFLVVSANSDKGKVASLEKGLEKLSEENKGLKSTVSNMQESAKTDDAKSKVAALEKTLEKLSKENDALKGEITGVMESAKTNDDKDKIASLENTLEKISRENDALKSEVTNIRQNSKAGEDKSNVAELEKTLEKLSQENDALKNEVSDIKDSVKASGKKGQKTTVKDLKPEQLQAVVFIVTVNVRSGSAGSGIMLNDDGYILTNKHVVFASGAGRADDFAIGITSTIDKAPDYKYVAKIYDCNPNIDLAILKIYRTWAGGSPPSKFPHLSFGDDNKLKPTDDIMAVGYPGVGGGTITFTRGSFGGRIGNAKFKTNINLLHGNSGGPVFNEDNNVVGVATEFAADFSDAGDEKVVTGQLGYCISSAAAMDYLKKKGVKFYKQ